MKSNFLFLLFFFILFYSNLLANNGSETNSVTGTIIDVKTGETLAGALISIVGTDIKTYSDLDGNFKIENVSEVPVEIKVSLISYKEYTLKNKIHSSSNEELIIQLVAF